MEILSSDNLPNELEYRIIPLFVLDSFLMPGDSMMMRVFEPRYKQMLDDTSIDSLPYGHVVANPALPLMKGWSAPYDIGTLVDVNELEENGSNLLYGAIGGERFRIIKIIPPELENIDFGGIFPSVFDLEQKYSETKPTGKLYLRAVIEIIPELVGKDNESKWDNLISLWESYILQIAEITGVGEDDYKFASELKAEFTEETEDNIWRLAALVVDSVEGQLECLKSEYKKEVLSIIESHIQNKMKIIKFFRESNE